MKQITDDIYDINAELNKTFVIIDERNAQLNDSAYKIEDIVSEYYARTSLDYLVGLNLVIIIVQILYSIYITIGFSFQYPSVEQISEGRKFAKTMGSSSKKGSVQKMEDSIVIKLYEDIYGK